MFSINSGMRLSFLSFQRNSSDIYCHTRVFSESPAAAAPSQSATSTCSIVPSVESNFCCCFLFFFCFLDNLIRDKSEQLLHTVYQPALVVRPLCSGWLVTQSVISYRLSCIVLVVSTNTFMMCSSHNQVRDEVQITNYYVHVEANMYILNSETKVFSNNDFCISF